MISLSFVNLLLNRLSKIISLLSVSSSSSISSSLSNDKFQIIYIWGELSYNIGRVVLNNRASCLTLWDELSLSEF